MHDDTTNVTGAVTGAAIAALAGFVKNDDDTQQRLRTTQQDVRTTIQMLQAFKARGEVLRARLPVVQDFQAGLSAASTLAPTASVIPSTVQQIRPNLAANMEAVVSVAQWPPLPGQYDENGMVQTVGDMGVLAEVLTLQETRALIQAAAQGTAPSSAGLAQIWRAVNALIYQLTQQGLSWQQYQLIWATLFGSGAGSAEQHSDPNKPPLGAIVQASKIDELTSSKVPAYPYANRNTDARNAWRVVASASGNGQGSILAHVTYGQEYRYLGAGNIATALVPSVATNIPHLIHVENLTHQGFDLVATLALGASASLDVHVSVTAGIGTV